MDVTKLLKDPRILVILSVVIVITLFAIMSGGGVSGNVSGNAKVDSSKSVTTTTTSSSDSLSGGSVKLGNVGSIGGNLDLSKHNTNTKNEGN